MEEYRKQVLRSIHSSQFAFVLVQAPPMPQFTLWINGHKCQMMKSVKPQRYCLKTSVKPLTDFNPRNYLKSFMELGVTSDMLYMQLSMNFMQKRQQCQGKREVTICRYSRTLAGPLFWLAYISSYTPPSSRNTTMYADDITCYITCVQFRLVFKPLICAPPIRF